MFEVATIAFCIAWVVAYIHPPPGLFPMDMDHYIEADPRPGI